MIDVRTYGAIPNGVFNCISAINSALIVDDITIQNGTFLINESIKIPSNRTVYLKNCKIRMAAGSYDNMFRNSDLINGNTNVRIIGLGNAVLDGDSVGNSQGVDYAPYGYLDSITCYKANQIIFCRVTNFEIRGITTADRIAYFMTLQRSSFGVIDNIFFTHYSTQRNQDGIAVRHDCHDIDISNLNGNVGDDVVSCNVGNYCDLNYKDANYNIGNCYNINFNNINMATAYHGNIFIAGDGNKIHDITYNNVILRGCHFLCYFGIQAYYTVPPTQDDVKDITMDNILVRGAANANGVLHFGNDCKNITITNFVNQSGKPDYIRNGGVQSNVYLNGVAIFP